MRVFLLSLSLLLCTPAWAADGEPVDRAAEQTVTPSEDSSAGESSEAVLRPDNGSIEGLSAEAKADGTLRVDLDHRFTHALVLRVAPDGTRTIECVDSAAHVQEMMRPRHPSDGDGEEKGE